MPASSASRTGNDVARDHAALIWPAQEALDAVRRLDLNGRTVLLAADSSSGAVAGARIARALAAKFHAVIHVVSVVDTRTLAVPPPLDIALATGAASLEPSLHDAKADTLRTGLSAITGEAVDWPVRVVLGTPAAAIVQEARRTNAALIIVGLRRQGRLDRALHDETALTVMRGSTCPVLGVAHGANTLPTRVLAAVDFTPLSSAAVRSAKSVAGENALLVVAYVAPAGAPSSEESEARIHELGVRAAFAHLAEELNRDDVVFDYVVLHQAVKHSIASAILDYAAVMECDLIVTGTSRRGRLDRWLMGSVSTEIVRDGTRSVLIVPQQQMLPG